MCHKKGTQISATKISKRRPMFDSDSKKICGRGGIGIGL